MKKWVLKAIVQKTISYLPLSTSINYFFQKYVTKGVYLTDEYFYDRLSHARDHLKSYKQFSGMEIPATCLEIGTGWYPVVPISFFLAGAEKIYSVDISLLTSKERIKTTVAKIVESKNNGTLPSYLPVIPQRMETVENLLKNFESLSLQEILARMNITYLIEDARHLSLESNSIDLVNSNNTFEHIYPEILKPILAEFKRVVKKETGVMSHFIDMSDHFAHFDKSINIYNFLRFSDNEWKWIDNSIQPQSRLRMDDYKNIYRELKIPISAQSFRLGNLDKLNTIPLNQKFRDKSKEEIAISHCHFVSYMNRGI